MAKRQFDKIAIIGVGLVGGSIGLAIKKRRIAGEVIGVFRRRSTLKKALRFKAIDKATMNVHNGVKDADLIILASPVFSIPRLARQAILSAKKGSIITDVGSTKFWIVSEIEKHLKPSSSLIYFVGSHPMAGSEHTGVEFSTSDLLKDAPCIVTKTNKTNMAALAKIRRFWSSLGARVTVMNPRRHDRAVSLISHIPHIVAFSLAGAVPEEDIEYAAEGFRDTTRVASSDPKLWSDIFFTNRPEVLRSCRIFERYYGSVKKALSTGSYSELVRLLERAKAKRDRSVYAK